MYYNINAVKSSVSGFMENSVLFPILVETGGFIMKIDTTEITEDINATIDEATEGVKEAVEEQVQEAVENATQEIVDDAKAQIQESMPEMVEELKNNEGNVSNGTN